MKKLYNKYFRLPVSGRMSDNLFMIRITVTICVIILMLAAMTFTSYAYFSSSISSAKNVIKASSYKLAVTPPVDTDVTVLAEWGEGSYLLDNSGGSVDKVYSFNLTDVVESIATVGYCKIDIKTDINDPIEATDKQTFYTEPIWNSDFAADTTKTVSRDIKITVKAGKTAKIKFTSEWGTCNITSIVNDTIEPEFLSSSTLSLENPVAEDNKETEEADNIN